MRYQGCEIRSKTLDGVVRITLEGELDMAAAPMLEDRLIACERDGADTIILELSGLTYVDSCGLRSFLRARDRAERSGHRLRLVGAGRPVRRLLEITGTEYLVDEGERMGPADRLLGLAPTRPGRPLALGTDGIVEPPVWAAAPGV
jgi:anti-anti-sigma factor